MAQCKNCGKECKKMYCCGKCRGLYYYHNDLKTNTRLREESKKRYHTHKNEPEYKKKHKGYFDTWRAKHHDKFNEICRNAMRKRYVILKAQSAERIKQGLCGKCGKPNDNKDWKQCTKCRESQRGHYIKRKEPIKADGIMKL